MVIQKWPYKKRARGLATDQSSLPTCPLSYYTETTTTQEAQA